MSTSCIFTCFLIEIPDFRVPYISHVVFNAGVASFDSICWWPFIKQLLTDPMGAMTAPTYYSQHAGEISSDNLGWVWQSNVFGHFALVSF